MQAGAALPPVEHAKTEPAGALPGLLAGHAATLVEHTRAEQAVKDLETRLHTVVETSTDGFLMVDAAGRVLAANRPYAQRSGYSQEELLTLHIADLEAQENPEQVRQHQALIRQRGAHLFQTQHRTRSGECWPVEVNVVYRPEAGGRYFSFVRDISERAHLEMELRLSEERFRLAMEATEDGIWDWNVKTGAVYFSPGYAAMLGYAPEEVAPEVEFWSSRLHPEEADAVLDHVTHAMAEAGRCSTIFRTRRKDGQYIWIQAHGKVVERDADGHPVRAIGTHKDITTRMQAQQAAENTRNQLSEAQKIAHLGSFEYDVPSNTAVWSEEQYRIFGFDPAGPCPTLEEFLSCCLPSREVEPGPAGLDDGGRRTQHHDQECRIFGQDGSVHWIHIQAHAHLDEQGRLLRYVGTTQDITERKHREEAAHAHEEFMHAMARQLVAVQTAAAFAHELNQPLLAIAAYSEVALNMLHDAGAQPDALARVLESCHAQALRAGQVLNSLNNHLHNGVSAPGPFDLNALVRKAVLASRKRGPDGFRVRLDLDPGLPRVHGDRLQTEKVLANLIQNSLEAMVEARTPASGFTIEVRTQAIRDLAQVTLRDNGPGLNAELARHIFAPFFSTKPDGLGLGLTISRALIQAQLGQLWLDPVEGPGAVFHFTLPLAHD